MFTIFIIFVIRDTSGGERQNANQRRSSEKNSGVGSSGKSQHELAAAFR